MFLVGKSSPGQRNQHCSRDGVGILAGVIGIDVTFCFKYVVHEYSSTPGCNDIRKAACTQTCCPISPL